MPYEPKRIKADGKKTAKIVLIGEAGGRDEARALRPFVGMSGRLLSKWWGEVGLSRKDFWIDNVYPFTPPFKGGSPQLSMVHPEDLKFWTEDLHARLAELQGVNVIVPTGDLALRALTGMKGGITRYRGSMLSYQSKWFDRPVKVIPTIHPAATFRRPTFAKACVHDWRLIAEEAKTAEIVLPKREHFTRPVLDDLAWFEAGVEHEQEICAASDDFPPVLAIDCEWVPSKEACTLLCVGFALSTGFSFTIPTTLGYWKNDKKYERALDSVRYLCESNVEKVLHHGHSDAYVLRKLHGISINNYRWDTLAMHHCLDPNDEHNLAYLASMHTREPYWKDEAKDPDKIAVYASNFDALLTYNGKDVAVTRELFDIFYEQLKERNLMFQYYEHYTELFPAMLDMMTTGLNVNQQKRRWRQLQLQADIIEIQDKLTEIIGEQCFAKKSLKGQVMLRYFNETLKLPKVMRVRKKKGGEKVKSASADEVAIRRWMLKYPAAEQVGNLVLSHRRKYQLLTFYGESRIDGDGRFCSSYAPYADTGRFRSSETPLGGGGNGQNVDRETRDIYVPDAF